MSDPYREASGPQCPRCRQLLAPDDETGDLVCLAACGRWLANEGIEKLMPLEWLKTRATINTFPLAVPSWAFCPFCATRMMPKYGGFARAVTINICDAHGAWMDDPDRAAFSEVYGDAIRQHADARALAGELSDLVAGLTEGRPTAFRTLVDKITAIEQRLAALEGRR